MNHLFRSLNLLMETPQYNELPLITLMAFTILKILIYFIPLSNYSLPMVLGCGWFYVAWVHLREELPDFPPARRGGPGAKRQIFF